jgi:threonine dehydrogenase-like Zn-dependent dehydrogenase
MKLSVDMTGSDMHWYRGHVKRTADLIMGHEVVGKIVEAGAGVKKFRVGDVVIAPFSLSCGELNMIATHIQELTSQEAVSSAIEVIQHAAKE